MTEEKTLTIDAGGQSLGRVASAAAKALMGKTRADYVPHVNSDVKVTIVNAAKLHSTEKKRNQKTYTSYSGYPGGIRYETWAQLAARKGGNAEVLRRAISRMLPRNTMKTARMKNLTITN
ncbi:MAG TPA: 50S ribosomal protein L13 [Candidatus Paceibacterota bacterium]|jgi:large subunit ribosomal protein L13|nr:50S ribosomal protein L13 [Candidatus Paceibacterota bacterium]